MSTYSPEDLKKREDIFKEYADKRKQKRESDPTPLVDTTEQDLEKNQIAQEMAGKLFDRADTIDEADYKKISTLSDLRGLIGRLDQETLEKINTDLASEGKNPEEIIKLLKEMVSGVDKSTKLQNRAALSDSLRQTIIELIGTKDTTEREEKMRRSGMIYFDVRGLKMVNDSRGDHADGDAFIALVASVTKLVSEQIFTKVLGEQTIGGIFRDGGDEFAITFQDSNHDLEQTMTEEKIREIFPETVPITRETDGQTDDLELRDLAVNIFNSLKSKGEANVTLIKILSEVLSQVLLSQKFVSELYPREVIENHLKKGNPEYTNSALADFDLPLITAQGAQSNYEVFQKTKASFYKKILPQEKIDQLDAAGVVNIFMSAMRLSADQKSYDAKNYQNRTWMESKDPFQQLLIDLVSRNEITVAYAESLREAKNIIVDIHEEKGMLTEELAKTYQLAKERESECDKLKQELENTYRLLEQKMTELEQVQARIARIDEEKHNQLNPDLTDGGGI